MAQNLVKFKSLTESTFNALSTKESNTLYFITDKNLFFKGSSLYGNVDVATKSTDGLSVDFSIKKADGTAESFTTPTSSGLSAAITTHAAVTGSDKTKGHVELSDSTASSYSSNQGVAATPKAVKDALDAAKAYADGILAANDAMVFKGTIGASGSNPTVTALPSTYNAGWTYRVITAGSYAGQNCEVGDLIIAVKDASALQSVNNSDWCVAQTNIDGAVTAANTLTADAIMLGNGNKTAKTLGNGSADQVLKIDSNGKPAWVTQSTSVDPSNLSSAVPVAKGGTGATTAAGARANLGLGDAAVKGVASSVTSGGTDLPTSGAVYSAIQSAAQAAAPEWEELT